MLHVEVKQGIRQTWRCYVKTREITKKGKLHNRRKRSNSVKMILCTHDTKLVPNFQLHDKQAMTFFLITYVYLKQLGNSRSNYMVPHYLPFALTHWKNKKRSSSLVRGCIDSRDTDCIDSSNKNEQWKPRREVFKEIAVLDFYYYLLSLFYCVVYRWICLLVKQYFGESLVCK